MSELPIFVATHPRACSTAFERVFMTRTDLCCIHEPFGDAFYYGPERLSSRFAEDERARIESGFEHSTYQTILDQLEIKAAEGKRLYIKDMAYYLMAPEGGPTYVAPSIASNKRGVGTSESQVDNEKAVSSDSHVRDEISGPVNPTVIPTNILGGFHFAFLIRHPRNGIPSYYRCTVPPLDNVTGFHDFMASEAGYRELRVLFDYLRAADQIGLDSEQDQQGSSIGDEKPLYGATENSKTITQRICVVDADDLLDNPVGILQGFCDSVGLKFDHGMLSWDTTEAHQKAAHAFEKWKGWHEDAIASKGLTPREHKKDGKSKAEDDAEWAERFGISAAKIIRETVDANVEDYKYLKQFALKPKDT